MRIHVTRLRFGPQFDMTPDGRFIEAPRPTLSEKLLRLGIIVAVIAALAGVAALALWLALVLIPVALAAAAIAYAAFRWRLWRLSRSTSQQGPPFRSPFQP
jgi:predicted lysophospholipase L1 biosynthesis ABC-type transport system permease subunit